MGDADRRELENGSQVDGEACSARVVGPGGIDEQHLGWDSQTTHRRLKDASYPRGQEAGGVGRGGLAESHAAVH